jgi:hypothetical protein
MAGPILTGGPHESAFSHLWQGRRGLRAAARQEGDFPALFHEAEFHRRLGRHAAELRSLLRERDPGMFYEGLAQLGRRLEGDGQEDVAREIYAAMVEKAPANVRTLAQERLGVLNGGGGFGQQAERFVRRAPEETFHSSMFLGLIPTMMAGKVLRLGALSWLYRNPAVKLWSRGLGAQVAAGLISVLGEAAVLPVATRVGALALGEKLSWEPEQLRQEAWGSLLFLGGMRLVTGGASGVRQFIAARRPMAAGINKLMHSGWGHQASLIGGIALGQQFETWAGLRAPTEGSARLFEILSTYGQVWGAGVLTSGLLGDRLARWEQGTNARIEAARNQSRRGDIPRATPLTVSAGTGSIHRASPSGVAKPLPTLLPVVAMSGEGSGSAGSAGRALALRPPRMGLLPPGKPYTAETRPWCVQAEAALKQLTPNGQVQKERLADDDYVRALLSCYGVTGHPLDLAAFRRGWELARTNPTRVQQIAFDIDEVYLHWGFSFGDLFRGLSDEPRGKDPSYENTRAEFLESLSFDPDSKAHQEAIARLNELETSRLTRFEKIWYRYIQKFLKGRMRQHLQFHPGIRAFQLGLRLGQNENLIMVTTSPTSRILVLANEDPAMRMIYFGKGPQRVVMPQDVQNFSNIYTRKHLAEAVSAIVRGMNFFHEDVLVRDYIERIQRDPDRAVKFKHPALAILLSKERFSILVDDSAATYEMLGGLPNFTVLQMPSARPKRTLNFIPGSIERYLCRMSNACVTDLAERLESKDRPASQVLPSPASTPVDYPHQRLAIEIPWWRFEREFVQPGRELVRQVRSLGAIDLGEVLGPISNATRMSQAQERLEVATARLHKKLNLWITATGAQSAVEFEWTAPLEEMARQSPDDFNLFLRRHLTEGEINRLPNQGTRLEFKGEDYFARVAALIAAKKAAFRLLGVEWGSLASDLEFRVGVASVTGLLKGMLGERVLSLSMTRSMLNQTPIESAGVGVALLEEEPGQSRLAGIGIDARFDLVRNQEATRLALAEAAHKAVFPGFGPGEDKSFDPRYVRDLVHRGRGDYVLQGRLANAARALGGVEKSPEPLPIRVMHLHAGADVFGLVGIPTPLPTTQPPPPDPSSPVSPEPEDNLTPSNVTAPVSPAKDVVPVSAAERPYVELPDGTYGLPREGMEFAVLGDVAGKRTFQLASEGHSVLHIDWDPSVLISTEEVVATFKEAAKLRGKLNGQELRMRFVNANWYETTAQADRVEAFYPLDRPDVPPPGDSRREGVLRTFVQQALLTKLKPGGAGFVVSEDWMLIDNLAEIISREPGLELAETAIERQKPPIVGGYGVSWYSVRHSWLIFAFHPPQK